MQKVVQPYFAAPLSHLSNVAHSALAELCRGCQRAMLCSPRPPRTQASGFPGKLPPPLLPASLTQDPCHCSFSWFPPPSGGLCLQIISPCGFHPHLSLHNLRFHSPCPSHTKLKSISVFSARHSLSSHVYWRVKKPQGYRTSGGC